MKRGRPIRSTIVLGMRLDLFSWPGQLLCLQGMPAGVGDLGNGMSWGKGRLVETIFCDPLRMGSEGKGRTADILLQNWE